MPLTEDHKAAIRLAYDKLSKAMPNYRRRPQQMKMIAEVARALAGDRDKEEPNIALVNGPTGVGKTFGYLVPGIVMAKAAGAKLVISTGTVALQEQLLEKDIPAMLKYSGLSFTPALAKGRTRYACPVRLDRLAGHGAQDDWLGDANWDHPPAKGEVKTIVAMSERLASGKWDGDRDALKEEIDHKLWMRITNDGHGCMGRKCTSYSVCPYYAARAKVFTADVIVANHDLVLATYAREGGLLPKADEALFIFDEGHHLPDIAVNQLAVSFGIKGAASWIKKMPSALSGVARIAGNENALLTVKREAEGLEQILEAVSLDIAALSANGELPVGGKKRFNGGVLPESMLEHVRKIKAMADRALDGLDGIDTSLQRKLGEAEGPKKEIAAKAAADLGFFIGRMANISDTAGMIDLMEDADGMPVAKWLRHDEKGDDIHLSASPIQAGPILSNLLWSKAKAVAVTSATMTALGDFEWYKRATGLGRYAVVEAVLHSPFDHAAQGELHLPKMQTDPSDIEKHTTEVSKMIKDMVANAKIGGALVLCTSKKQMEAIAATLDEAERNKVMVQGQLPKLELIKQHKSKVESGLPSIIIGLASFGEGVDLPGALCEEVVICKLPFAPPDTPVEETLAEWIEKNGRNPFMEVTLPKASLKLIQWVGRLIRTEEDHGRIMILDRRIVTKRYGSMLIQSLPPFRRV